jgi:hypothetical protein
VAEPALEVKLITHITQTFTLMDLVAAGHLPIRLYFGAKEAGRMPLPQWFGSALLARGITSVHAHEGRYAKMEEFEIEIVEVATESVLNRERLF